MPRTETRPDQVSVTLTRRTRGELEKMESEGQIFSVAEFIRAAVDEKLLRWKKDRFGLDAPT